MKKLRTQFAALLAIVSAVIGVAAGSKLAEIEGYKGWARVEGQKPRPLESASAGG